MALKPEEIIIREWHSQPRSGWSMAPIVGVRIIHIPTGAIVQVDTERSVHKNKAIAMQLLAQKVEAIMASKGLPILTQTPPVPILTTPVNMSNWSAAAVNADTVNYITAAANQYPTNLVFQANQGKEVGRLEWSSEGVTFKGNADEAAQHFIKCVNDLFKQEIVRSFALEQQLKELQGKYDAMLTLAGNNFGS